MRGGVSIFGAIMRGIVVFTTMTASLAIAFFFAITGPPSSNELSGVRDAAGQALADLARGGAHLAERACHHLPLDARERLGCPPHPEVVQQAQATPLPPDALPPEAPPRTPASPERSYTALAGAAQATTVPIAAPVRVTSLRPHPHVRPTRSAHVDHVTRVLATHPVRHAVQTRAISAHERINTRRTPPRRERHETAPARATAIATHPSTPASVSHAAATPAAQHTPPPHATSAVALESPAPPPPPPAAVPHAQLAGPEPSVAAAPASAPPLDAQTDDAPSDNAPPEKKKPSDDDAANAPTY